MEHEDDFYLVIGKLYMENLYKQNMINGLKEQSETHMRERELHLAPPQANPHEENENGSLSGPDQLRLLGVE